MRYRKNLSGNRYGKLVVLQCVGNNKHGSSMWECVCDCGNHKTASSNHLVMGGVKSCGCLARDNKSPKHDLEGCVFGRLTVLNDTHIANIHNRRIRLWRCKCSCGNICYIRQDQLLNGNNRSCGCLASESQVLVAKRNFTKHGKSGTTEYKRIKSHRRREMQYMHDNKWTIEMDRELHKLQPCCAVCGNTDRLEVDHVLPLSRNNGLLPGNAVILCTHCNSKKSNKLLTDLPIDWQSSIIWSAFKFKIHWDKLTWKNTPQI